MQDLILFLMKHWLLSGLFVIFLILILVEEVRSKGLLNQLIPHAATQLINREQAVVIDIRDVDAFRSGHIVGAIHIPSADIERQMNKLNAYKDRPLIIV